MKVELHLHTSRYSGCATATVQQLMKLLIDTGYGAVYITEHDAVWRDWELEAIQQEFGAIRIFPGVEVTVSNDPLQHLVVLGTNDPAYLQLTSAEILHRSRDAGHLTILAHPFRWSGAGEMLEEKLLPDALEYQTCNHDAAQACKAKMTAQRLRVPLVNAGDVHALDFVGRYWIETRRPIEKADDIRQIILGGEYANCSRDEEDPRPVGWSLVNR